MGRFSDWLSRLFTIEEPEPAFSRGHDVAAERVGRQPGDWMIIFNVGDTHDYTIYWPAIIDGDVLTNDDVCAGFEAWLEMEKFQEVTVTHNGHRVTQRFLTEWVSRYRVVPPHGHRG